MASHPAIGREPEFESPYKPPPGFADLIADMDPVSEYPYSEVVAGQLFRFHRAHPKALATFVSAQSEFNSNDSVRVRQLVRFIHHHTHPDDLATMLLRLIEDDTFGMAELDELVEAIAKAGTARPTKPSSPWQRRRPHIGAKYGRA